MPYIWVWGAIKGYCKNALLQLQLPYWFWTSSAIPSALAQMCIHLYPFSVAGLLSFWRVIVRAVRFLRFRGTNKYLASYVSSGESYPSFTQGVCLRFSALFSIQEQNTLKCHFQHNVWIAWLFLPSVFGTGHLVVSHTCTSIAQCRSFTTVSPFSWNQLPQFLRTGLFTLSFDEFASTW